MYNVSMSGVNFGFKPKCTTGARRQTRQTIQRYIKEGEELDLQAQLQNLERKRGVVKR